jgi:dienelactone hydrolase
MNEELRVRIERQGCRLAGVLTKTKAKEPRPGIVLLHGFTSHKDEDPIAGRTTGYYAYTAERLNEAGYQVLRFDFSGHGESDGDFQEITISALVSDALAAADFLARQPGVQANRIGLIGSSLGGIIAACSAARDKRIRSVALWNAPPYPLHTLSVLLGWERISEAFRSGSTSFPWEGRGQVTLRKAFFDELVTISPLVEIAKFQGPMLVVVTRQDPYINPQPQMGMAYISSHAGAHRIVEIDGDHTFSVKVRGARFLDQIIQETLRWFEETV